ncbi:DNA-3-methyladenine glycosylase [Desulfosarcina sp. OttesenSCG-928-G17]|nr:DNA-3-methyladenine glycosylase [Desulfosarcina sp. OttesenSCG-928-G17]
MYFFKYGEKELDHLRKKDAKLRAVIDEIGFVRRETTPDLFSALVFSIVGQQISTKAGETIRNRMISRFGPLSPERISALNPEAIQECGISMRKVQYIKAIADRVGAGELDMEKLRGLSDEEVCRQLCTLKGIGVWTAEMLMIFSMQRPNILSWGDIAIHRGLRMLYRHQEITPVRFEKYRRRYSPHASVASLYLWAIAGGACKKLSDPATAKK